MAARAWGPSEVCRFGLDLYWLPLGAGGHFVRLNGRIYEALVAWRERRPREDLYHSALIVTVPDGRFVIEQAWPVPAAGPEERGVVREGSVGSRLAGSLRVFRYEIRRWRDGVIADLGQAVASPLRLSDDVRIAEQVRDFVPQAPTPVWGRDELRAGEMWNSNSLVSWLIASSGLDVDAIQPPTGGRAPGWRAGIVVARRQLPSSRVTPDRGDRRIGPAAELRAMALHSRSSWIMRGDAWIHVTSKRSSPMFLNLWGVSAPTTTMSPGATSTSSPSAVNRPRPERTIQVSE
jgi:hypothetical protein